MLKKFQDIYKIPELRRRITFTLALLIVYRVGGHIPAPGVNGSALVEFFAGARDTLLGLYDMFSGGNLSKATIFALGIMPYISASIILQLLTAVIPYFERLQKEGEEGRKKITQYTRYGTIVLSVIQSFGISKFLEGLHSPESGLAVVNNPGLAFELLTVLTLTSGTAFIMWLGEQITERGIGNGISLIIFIGIVARYPTDILNTIRALRTGALGIFPLLILVVIMLAITAGIVAVTQGQRKIPVQYAKRIMGRKVYGGQTTHIPLRVNTAGVIPVIFAQSIVSLPGTFIAFFSENEILLTVKDWLSPGGALYSVLYALLIIFFTYFYTAIIFNPVDLSENLKKYGGFIPGIRPGKKTADYIDNILTRITLPGAFFLAVVALAPYFLIQEFNAPFYFGGTALIIVVGVALDTLQQIESHLLMRHYEGFMKKGKLRARR